VNFLIYSFFYYHISLCSYSDQWNSATIGGKYTFTLSILPRRKLNSSKFGFDSWIRDYKRSAVRSRRPGRIRNGRSFTSSACTHTLTYTHTYTHTHWSPPREAHRENTDDRSRCDEVFDLNLFTSLLCLFAMPGFIDISSQRMACALLSLLPFLSFFNLAMCHAESRRRCSHSAHDVPVSMENAKNVESSSTSSPRRLIRRAYRRGFWWRIF